MTTMTKNSTRLSRRAFLGTMVAGAGLIGLPFSLRAAPAAAGAAIAFDGDALILAGDTLSRSDGSGGWMELSAPAAGGIISLATHPARPGRIAAGLAGGGIALSEDGGDGWEARSQGLPDAPVTAVTVAAAVPDTIYAAIHGDGLWKSEDAGRSWALAMDRPWLADAERDVTALASVDLATGMGGIWIYAGTELGLTRVPDCFCRWQDVQPGDAMDALVSGNPAPSEAPLPEGMIHGLASAASLPTRLYAALPSGIWKSQDAGVVWSQISGTSALAVAVHPTNADQVVAITGDGLVESRDGGANWTALARA
ncbi:WD40/YVTN/BNR-like repeat-containing protein [Hoeflea sp.]|uniref:WD40/YVTN/BNR-like repeat-containing protein n=1 Tax=Hoeflea sp. TaxID=1940281 RepID=UPI003B520026